MPMMPRPKKAAKVFYELMGKPMNLAVKQSETMKQLDMRINRSVRRPYSY